MAVMNEMSFCLFLLTALDGNCERGRGNCRKNGLLVDWSGQMKKKRKASEGVLTVSNGILSLI